MSVDTPNSALDLLDGLVPGLEIDGATADLLFREAHTTYGFTDDPVSDEQLRAVWDLVKWAPTAINSLPLRMLVIRSDEAKQRLAPHMADFNRDRMLAAPVTIVAAADPGFHRHLKVLAPFRQGAEEQMEPQVEMRESVARTSALLQVGYLLVGLRAAGLGVGPMTGFDAAGIDAEFFGDTGYQTLVAISVGVPSAQDSHRPRQARLDFDTVATTL